MNYTIDDLKPFEKAARILCAKRAVDPDMPINRAEGTLFAPRAWHWAAEELIHLSQALTAIKEASEELPALNG